MNGVFARGRFVVFAVALLVRLAVVAWARARFPPVEDGHYYDVLAHRLAAGAGYTWSWPDGAVTYAAHYPVGYPALLAALYAIFGGAAGVAMVGNAILGAVGACAASSLVDEPEVPRWRPLAAGLAVALHPALVPYTAAVMTEGVTASILTIAASLVVGARRAGAGASAGVGVGVGMGVGVGVGAGAGAGDEGRRTAAWVVAVGVVMGIATLVRPQSLLLAPILGALTAGALVPARRVLARGAAVTAIALLCVAPWTARNCARMHRCALVSVNGGWNLLIGAQTRSGSWEPVAVPPECATVWDEAAKDACFERAARRIIAAEPVAWLARVPGKLAATLDYFGAAPWYLHASNGVALDDAGKLRLAEIETVACRLLLLGALVSCGRREGPRPMVRKALALAGAIFALTVHAWVAYAALVVCAGLLGARALWRGPLAVPLVAAVSALTAIVHAAFFGAGRYGLVVVPFVAAATFVAPRPGRPRLEALAGWNP